MRLRSGLLGASPDDAEARRTLMQRNFSLFGAPVVVWLCMDRALSQWSLYDLGSFAQSLMLAAAEKGLDSVPAVMLAAYPDIVRTELGVPDSLAIAIGIALGHAEREDPMNKLRTPRRSLVEILTVRGL